MSRRAALEALLAGPALVANLPADEVDLDRLVAHLVGRRFGGAVHVASARVEGLLWVYDGAARYAWIFETGGVEAVMEGEEGRDLIRQIAAKGGAVSVHPGVPPAPPAQEAKQPAWVEPVKQPEPPPYVPTPSPDRIPGPADVSARPSPADTPARAEPVSAQSARSQEAPPQFPPEEDPSPLPWPAILEEVAERVARHRGPRLAARFMSAVGSALSPYGGSVANGRIIAPPLARSTWRIIVETACGPVVAIAGRAFVDRTIAAAERHVAGGTKDGDA